ncbi:hypothetical protein AB0A69_27555 [Streptomyces sp. NPDC045431]|uniref:hypothetical protein n=1 Tax=Streptomyces sp. NPDC045431 TaxID=3155613 RepID=UPI00340810EE
MDGHHQLPHQARDVVVGQVGGTTFRTMRGGVRARRARQSGEAAKHGGGGNRTTDGANGGTARRTVDDPDRIGALAQGLPPHRYAQRRVAGPRPPEKSVVRHPAG